MQTLTFTKFMKNDKTWFVFATNKLGEDSWRCDQTREVVICKRADLLRWKEKGLIVPFD